MRFKVHKNVMLLLLLCVSLICQSWGFWAHKRINRIAVYTLPPQMLGFYKSYIEYVTEHSVDADKRRHNNKEEAPRHYIDLEFYGNFDSIPKTWKAAVTKYSEDSLYSWGIVPWHIQFTYYRLVEAFKENNAERILKTSADLGHYVSDAHVPLHTTVNYNGQLTNQHGIHGFWESRLPELFGNNYDYFVGKAQYIENPLNFAWHAVFEAHNALDSVLRFEKELSQQFSADKKYSYEARGATTIRVYSREYSAAYHNRLQGQVERQMKKAILAVGSLWYSAWVDAGQPILQKHINKQQPQPEKQQTDEEQQEYEGGHWLGRPE